MKKCFPYRVRNLGRKIPFLVILLLRAPLGFGEINQESAGGGMLFPGTLTPLPMANPPVAGSAPQTPMSGWPQAPVVQGNPEAKLPPDAPK